MQMFVKTKSKTEYHKLCEETVEMWESLKREGVHPLKIKEFLGVSRATYYRRKRFLGCHTYKSKNPLTHRKSRFGEDVYNKILEIRTSNPTYGKFKIWIILKRDFSIIISESSVWRILKKLQIPKSYSSLRAKKKRKFKGHAKPWSFKKYSDMEIGENVQIDHMTVTKNGVVMKHFGAWEMHTKHLVFNVFSDATAKSAKKFLHDVLSKIPYKIKSIQVDGGSEFKAGFEDA